MSVHIVRLDDPWPIRSAAMLVSTHFPPYMDVTEWDADKYQRLVAATQEHMNARGLGAMIAWQLREKLRELLGPGQQLIQNGAFLRAARPQNDSEVIGWHRESMYGGPPGTWNMWVPIANVNEQNCMQYIPGSEEIPDEDLRLVDSVSRVERGSAGQAIGLLYAPKRIQLVEGTNDFLWNAKPMIVPDGSVALFPGSLIHGAGSNKSDKIRFSLDMRVILQKNAG